MKIISFIFTTLFLSLCTLLGLVIYLLWHYGKELPDYRQLSKYEPSIVTRVHAGNGALLAEYAKQKRVFVPINVIPKKIIDAFLSAEDKDFYDHFGIDLLAITRALATNILSYHENKRHIYCPPQNVSIDGKRVMLLLPNFLVEAEKGNTKFNKFSGNTPLSAAVPILLIHTYPCS